MPLWSLVGCLSQLGVADPEFCARYADADGDSFGDPAVSEQQECATESEGWVDNRLDCDDSDAEVFPGAEVACTGGDNNCDGLADDTDADGDGFLGCEECDDTRDAAYPGADETCNTFDDDCDEVIDEEPVDPTTWFADEDDDGFGDPSNTVDACEVPEGFTDDDQDCDDARDDVYPEATEVCDGVDQDCDGMEDEDSVDAETWYRDADEDSYGDGSITVASCEVPEGYADNPDDCDDDEAEANPGRDEECDGIDNDCDGEADESDAVDALTWYPDTDSDGYGDSSSTQQACDRPSGWTAVSGDCDDDEADVNPGEVEACNAVDDDCDGDTDEDFDDTDSDGTADCIDDCPVYADPTATSGDGSSSSPYAGVNEAITLRGGFCDEIVLLAGTYYETIDYGGDDLDISSADGAPSTVLDASGSGSVVTFQSGETTAAVLEGVTLTNGAGSTATSPGTSTSTTQGGGLWVYSSDPTITDCIIEDNTTTGRGAGGWFYDWDGSFEGNTVRDNTSSKSGRAGAGLFLEDSAGSILSNTFSDNDATSTNSGGGAIYAYDGGPEIAYNLFEENEAVFAGGGLLLHGTSSTVYNNLFIDQEADAIAFLDGDSSSVYHNTMDGNGYGVYLYVTSSGSAPSVAFVNNLVTDSDTYGIDVAAGGFSRFAYNDVYGSGEDDYNGYSDPTGSNGNISQDPLYVGSRDFTLQTGSLAIDGGVTLSAVTDDYAGTARPTGTASDIGAYEQ